MKIHNVRQLIISMFLFCGAQASQAHNAGACYVVFSAGHGEITECLHDQREDQCLVLKEQKKAQLDEAFANGEIKAFYLFQRWFRGAPCLQPF